MTFYCKIYSILISLIIIVSSYSFYTTYWFVGRQNCLFCGIDGRTEYLVSDNTSLKLKKKYSYNKYQNAMEAMDIYFNKQKDKPTFNFSEKLLQHINHSNLRKKPVRSNKSLATRTPNKIINTAVENYFSKRNGWRTSNLGAILFKNANPSEFIRKDRTAKTYTVLVWKYWDKLKERHVKTFRGKSKIPEPLQSCSVKNCVFQTRDTYLASADAVLVYIQTGKFPISESRKNVNQRWIFLNDESPELAFSLARKKPKLHRLADKFNWSMTYRTDADIPVPYGRTVPRIKPRKTNFSVFNTDDLLNSLMPNRNLKRKDVLAAILWSNCEKERKTLIKKFQEYIDVDVFGACAKDKVKKKRCPGLFREDCNVTSEYLFYLALENSKCREYVTEKTFHLSYLKGAIPVISGPSLEDCEALLPPNSFLHVDQFKSIEGLAKLMKTISLNTTLLLSYHKWRNDFEILNEHGYFDDPSVYYCRVCEALNYNDDAISIYDETRIRYFLDPKINCN